LTLEIGVLRATSVSKLLFSSEYADLKFEDIIASFGDDPRLVKISKLEMLDTPITKLASKHGLVSSTCKSTFVNDCCNLSLIPSKAASRALVAARGLYLNNIPIQDLHSRIAVDDLLDHRIAVLRAGKDKMLVLASTD
jgi:tyrosyl-tRNA synthetase